jgi:hypothetical protein
MKLVVCHQHVYDHAWFERRILGDDQESQDNFTDLCEQAFSNLVDLISLRSQDSSSSNTGKERHEVESDSDLKSFDLNNCAFVKLKPSHEFISHLTEGM